MPNIPNNLDVKKRNNVLLSEYTTFKIGGPAKYFIETNNSGELIKAIEYAQQKKISYLILAGGSNVLVSDQGFDGLVIQVKSNNYKIEGNSILADSGVSFNRLVNESVKAGLSGLEWMVGIYGTIGGAVRGNAGAYGHSIAKSVEEVEIFDSGKIRKIKNKDCKFGYRESIFKHSNGIILSVELKLKKGNINEIQNITKETMLKRTKRIPIEPNAGSVFKNIQLSEIDQTRLIKGLDISDEEYKKLIKLGDFPAGYIIEALGYKGKKIGGAQVSDKHSNFIVNVGNAKASDVIMLISIIKQKARNKLGIQLHEEIQLIGF